MNHVEENQVYQKVHDLFGKDDFPHTISFEEGKNNPKAIIVGMSSGRDERVEIDYPSHDEFMSDWKVAVVEIRNLRDERA